MTKYIRLDDLIRFLDWENDNEMWELSDEELKHLEEKAIDASPLVHAEWSYAIRPMPSRATYDARATYDGLSRCSKCGNVFERLVGRKLFSYCPNCGAKMDGEKHE